jgi:NAD(P)-dependent dehydrogenase (short-subunit alcohol dehydrogenase family)
LFIYFFKEVKLMSEKLAGKSAVVTGGGDGVGRGVALALAAEGASVVVNDIGSAPDNSKTADKVVAEIIEAGGRAAANYDSVATIPGGENIINTAVSNFGRIDILVNCAGNFKTRKTVELTEEDWDSILGVHLKGHFSCVKAAIKGMIKQKSGRIVNISSRSAAFGAANLAYSVSKAGILGFTAMLSEEQKDNGITVNAILPSARTRLFPGEAPTLGDNIPIAPVREPEYVAPIIVYLCTDEAKNITGRYFYSSGGDICIYSRPLQLSANAPVLLRKTGKWTIDELSQVIPAVIR